MLAAFGFQFRGKVVVDAVLKSLVRSKGLGSGVRAWMFTIVTSKLL